MRQLLALIGIAFVATLAITSAGNAASIVNVRGELQSTERNPCTGEDVDLDVRFHYVLNVMANASTVSGTELLRLTAQGVGQDSGAHYAGGETSVTTFKGSFRNGQLTNTYVVTFRLTAAGGGNDWTTQIKYHITYNANGDVTVEHDDAFVNECR